jgi:hypothetical protein
VFNIKQLYFQCHAMHCLESIDIPLEALHYTSRQKMHSRVQFPRAFPVQGLSKYPTDLLDRIEEYSSRHLKFETDALRAFQGVLQGFQSHEEIETVSYGLPVFAPSSYSSQSKHSKSLSDRFVRALAWEMRKAPDNIKDAKIERRHDFPSWTWAGWKSNYNHIQFDGYLRPRGKLEHHIGCDAMATVSLDFGNGQKLDCGNDLVRLGQQLGSQHEVRFFHVRTKVLDMEWLDDISALASWPVKVRVRIPRQPAATGVISSHTIHIPPHAIRGLFCKALTFICRGGRILGALRFLLVARFPDRSYFERIGYSWITDRDDLMSDTSWLVNDIENWATEEIVIG